MIWEQIDVKPEDRQTGDDKTEIIKAKLRLLPDSLTVLGDLREHLLDEYVESPEVDTVSLLEDIDGMLEALQAKGGLLEDYARLNHTKLGKKVQRFLSWHTILGITSVAAAQIAVAEVPGVANGIESIPVVSPVYTALAAPEYKFITSIAFGLLLSAAGQKIAHHYNKKHLPIKYTSKFVDSAQL